MIVTISRQAATDGKLLAQMVAERLQYRVFDREVVDEIARRMDLHVSHVIPFDGTLPTPVESLLHEWRHSINQDVYYRHLREVLRIIERQFPDIVILGRGGNFVLKGPDTLRVRVMAPVEWRVAKYIAGEKVSNKEAEKYIADEDRRRASFTRYMFHRNIDNPLHYDVCMNLEGLTYEMVADIISHNVNYRQTVRR